mmetsp:Transcript_24604/g.93012  ORF Transcript_24604/g.93012 Transcript_24604/m.93012 type:complete len:212 (-) Transcript_24604:5306-5941(-)
MDPAAGPAGAEAGGLLAVRRGELEEGAPAAAAAAAARPRRRVGAAAQLRAQRGLCRPPRRVRRGAPSARPAPGGRRRARCPPRGGLPRGSVRRPERDDIRPAPGAVGSRVVRRDGCPLHHHPGGAPSAGVRPHCRAVDEAGPVRAAAGWRGLVRHGADDAGPHGDAAHQQSFAGSCPRGAGGQRVRSAPRLARLHALNPLLQRGRRGDRAR